MVLLSMFGFTMTRFPLHICSTPLFIELPQRWIRRAGGEGNCLAKCPPMSPDMTPWDFFLWGYLKDRVYVPPLPQNLEERKRRIREATTTVTEGMLQRVWQEFDYRVDICRVTRGSHIESLWNQTLTTKPFEFLFNKTYIWRLYHL
jgi:hypothetical protein